MSKKEEWKTKEQLLEMFHSIQMEKGLVSSKKREIVKVNTITSHTPNTEPVDEKCTFIITRGDKMGEKCSSRCKQGTSFCVKHYKPPKEDGSTLHAATQIVSTTTTLEQKEEKKEDKKEVPVKTFSLEMKFKKVETEQHVLQPLEIKVKDSYRIVNDSSVVVNDSNEIIGYLVNKNIVYGSNKEVDKIAKEYKLVVNKSNWKEDHIDE